MQFLIIILTGPIASGKTTQKLLLQQYFRANGRVTFALTQAPFSFATYSLLSFITYLLQFSKVNVTNSSKDRKHPLAFLEMKYCGLTSKLIKFFIFVDLFQTTLLLLLVKIFSKLRMIILIEDFIPAIIVDHYIYLRLFKNFKLSDFYTLSILYNFLLSTFLKDENIICIHLQGSRQVRQLRSYKRGYRIVDPNSLHDKVHERAIGHLVQILCPKCIMIETDQKTIKETFFEIRKQFVQI